MSSAAALSRREERALEPLLIEAADRRQHRHQAIADSRVFGETLKDDAGATRSYASLIPEAFALEEQLELELPGYSQRAAIRLALSRKIEHEVLPIFSPRWLEGVPMKLRTARRTGCFGISLSTQKSIVFWDLKAGLSRLCPDDAREEAMRLRRRVQKPLEELQGAGHQLTYAVFTLPNFAAGKLREGMRTIYERFKALLRARRPDGELVFPQIKGALTVLEAPLGAGRDWNVHLNVILVTRGFLDWKALRERWHWNVELRRLPSAPGAIGAALTELIKYAVAATVAKSEEHADRRRNHANHANDAAELEERWRRPVAPPMLEWTPRELAEWLDAMHGFRRTRTYGVLYGLETPEAEELGPIAWLGTVRLEAAGYRYAVALLDSIPEDKSQPGATRRDAWAAFLRRVRPPPIDFSRRASSPRA